MKIDLSALYYELAKINSEIAKIKKNIGDREKEYDNLGAFKSLIDDTGNNIYDKASIAKDYLYTLKKYELKNNSVKKYVEGMDDSLSGVGVNLVCMAISLLSGKCGVEKAELWTIIRSLEVEKAALNARKKQLEREIAIGELMDI